MSRSSTNFSHPLVRIIGRTGGINLVTAGVAAANGIMIARLLGPSARGDYAAVVTILGFTLLIFELGVGSGLVYWTSVDQHAARSYVSAATRALFLLAIPAIVADLVIAICFIPAGGRRDAAFLMPIAVLLSFLAAPATFSLQSLRISAWNTCRFLQPVVFICLTLALILGRRGISARGIFFLYCISVGVQGLIAHFFIRRLLTSPSAQANPQGTPTRRLFRFGTLNLLSTAPYALNARIDQLVLAFMVTSASLGNYAVAVSLSIFISPLASAFGNVAFPHLAKGGDVRSTVNFVLRGSLLTSMTGAVISVGVGWYLIPIVYGSGYTAAVPLLCLLAPGACFISTNQVLGDVLRGLGEPARVAKCEWGGAALTIGALFLSVPWFGAIGAACTSSLVYGLVFCLLVRQVRITSKERFATCE